MKRDRQCLLSLVLVLLVVCGAAARESFAEIAFA